MRESECYGVLFLINSLSLLLLPSLSCLGDGVCDDEKWGM